MNHGVSTAVAAACDEVVRRWPVAPRAGIVLGTGLGRLVRHVREEAAIPLESLPGFPRATALGHCGRIVCGYFEEVPVILLDGRCHLYEGYTIDDVTLPIRLLRACGVPLLIISNASGALNPRYAMGDVVVIDDHINLMPRRLPAGLGRSKACGVARSPYDAQLVQAALRSARRHDFSAHQGVYVSVPGPNYETRAEYRFLRRIGGDVVGMSTVPEVQVGHALGMRILALSVVTNVAAPDRVQSVDADDVVDVAAHAEPRVRRIAADIVGAHTG